jgi:hypothetical protein
MKKFAVMSGNQVTNIIVAENKETAEHVVESFCIEYTDENPAGIGWTYDEETNTFSPPIIEEPATEE